MHFSLFLDESGKTHQRNLNITSFCGYVGTMEDWGQFNVDWQRLQFKWSIPAIHMSRIMAPKHESKTDEWGKIRNRKGDDWIKWRDNMLDEFAELIARSNIACVGSVIDSRTYREISDADPQDFLIANADCSVFLLQHVLMSALDKIELVDKIGMLSVNIDDDYEHAFEYYKSYWNLQKMVSNPKLPETQRARFARIPFRVDQLAFCKDDHHAALQAADMVAYVARKAYPLRDAEDEENLFHTLYDLLTRGGTHNVQIYSEKDLKAIAGNTARSIRNARDEEDGGGM